MAAKFLCSSHNLGINLTQVKYYGELEFWFAGIKIVALIAFIVLGLFIFGIFQVTLKIRLSN